MGLLFSPIIGRFDSSRTALACCPVNPSGILHSRGGQQSQLLRHRHDQLLQAMHLLLKFLTVPVPITVSDEPLDRRSRKVGNAARAFLLANTDELTKFVF
jgi:hypothetical protein